MKIKIILIAVIVLLVITVVYIVYSKKKQAQEDASSKTAVVADNVPIMSGSPVQAGYVEPTSGVVTSKPKPLATVTTAVGASGAASVVAVLSNPLNLANCKIRCGSLHPFNKAKREACQAACR